MRSTAEKLAFAVAAGALLVAAGCGPKLTNAGLACGSGNSCPPSYHCAVDQHCWKDGQNPTAASDMSANVNGDLAGAIGDLGSAPPNDLTGVPTPDLATPLLALGQLCGAAGQCDSGFCVDGVCCDGACGSSCTSCNQSTNLGTCTPVPAGVAPSHGTCGPDTTMSCGRNGKCDGAGNCAKWDGTTVCGATACNAGQFTAAPRCNGNGSCVTPSPIACDPYVCKPDNLTCYTTCTGTGPAAECNGVPCTSGSCGLRGNGQTCGAGSDCKTGNCVDTVCCDTPAASCTGCRACNLGTPGTCANVPPGGDPHAVCAVNNATCTAGGCNGNGVCTASGSSITCASTCSSSQLSASLCNGTLGCPAAGAPMSCPGNRVCADGSSCKTSCSADGDCVSGYWCNANNCTPQGNYGAGCSASTQCLHGNCIDGVCCQTSACGGCNACNLSGDGSCAPVPSKSDPHHVCSTEMCQNGCNGAGSCLDICHSGQSCRCGGVCLTSTQMCP